MLISELIAALQEILDREGDVDARLDDDDCSYRTEVAKVQFREGYDQSASGGGWDYSHVLIA